jgi:glycosyltransferase involved in cell wall biosynthesis
MGSPLVEALHSDQANARTGTEPVRPLVSVVLPAFNEAAILERNLDRVADYLAARARDYRWEVIIVDDGSTDDTGRLADRYAARNDHVTVIHHRTNFGLGQAIKSGFNRSKGRYIVTLDIDLSYAPEHIGLLLDNIVQTGAKLVLASPYMRGGQLSHVPFRRRLFSTVANRFLGAITRRGFSTFTCMVRAYDGPFVRALSLRAIGMDIMPEVVYKTMVLQGRIEEIPAHLDWGLQVSQQKGRDSSMKALGQISATLVSGFLMRPILFFVLPGIALLAFAAYVITWMLIHFAEEYAKLPPEMSLEFSVAIANAYAAHPHTFVVGLLALVLSIQLIGLGFVSLQNKKNFEELYFLGTKLLQRTEALDEKRHCDRSD